MESAEGLARAAADVLSVQYGEEIKFVVEEVIKGNITVESAADPESRGWTEAINLTGSVLQIGWFIFEVSRYVWHRSKEGRDKNVTPNEVRSNVKSPPGITGNQRDQVIDTVVAKL